MSVISNQGLKSPCLDLRTLRSLNSYDSSLIQTVLSLSFALVVQLSLILVVFTSFKKLSMYLVAIAFLLVLLGSLLMASYGKIYSESSIESIN